MRQKMKAVFMNEAMKASDLPIQALLENDSFYQGLFRKLPVAIYTCDKEGHITYYNEAAVELWGREPAPGKDRWCGSGELFRPDGSPMPMEECPMAIALRQGKAVTGEEMIIRRPDGTKRHVLTSPQPVHDVNGVVSGAINLLQDITPNQLVEEKMAHLAAIVESSDDAIISKTLDGIITSWNKAAERIFGYTAAEAIGRHITMLIPPDRLQEEPLIVERLKKGERVDHFETKRVTRDGKMLDISLTISPIRDNNGRVMGASKIARDITAQKAAEKLIKENEERFKEKLEKEVEQRTAELQKSNEELGRSNHELEQYAYIASHDLQEPLRKIQTFAELLKLNQHDPEAVDSYYHKINQSARRMSSLIKDVLNYSKVSRSGNTLVDVDLTQVLQDVKSDFELLIEQKDARIEMGQLPVVKGDAQQLRQLFANLVSNSLKFSEEQPVVQVTSSIIQLPPGEPTGDNHLPPGKYAEVRFADNGIGFEQKYADQVFVVFKRLNNRHLYSGTGIGLAVCKRIVQKHGGSIRVTSTPGKGTQFTILLPASARQ